MGMGWCFLEIFSALLRELVNSKKGSHRSFTDDRLGINAGSDAGMCNIMLQARLISSCCR